MVGKFCTSRSPTSSASSSVSSQTNSACGNCPASASKPGRYSTQVSHQRAHRQVTRNSFIPCWTAPVADSLHALAGIFGLLGIAFVLGENRRAVPWRAVLVGVALQILLAGLFLKISFFREAFLKLNDALIVLEQAPQAGTSLVFGYLGGGKPPFEVSDPASSFILAFRALPIVLLISALSALLFYWRVLPAVVRALSWLLEKLMGVGGVVGLAAAANV